MSQLSANSIRLLGEAVRFYERHRLTLAQQQYMLYSGARDVSPITVKVTGAVVSGVYPGVVTTTLDGTVWTDGEVEIGILPANGETLSNGVRYSGLPTYTDDDDVPVYIGYGGRDSSYGTITVGASDGSPSYTLVGSLLIDQSTGINVTQPGGAGTATLSGYAASTTQMGMVTTTTQSFQGDKNVIGNFGVAGNILTGNPGTYIRKVNAGGLGYVEMADSTGLTIDNEVDSLARFKLTGGGTSDAYMLLIDYVGANTHQVSFDLRNSSGTSSAFLTAYTTGIGAAQENVTLYCPKYGIWNFGAGTTTDGGSVTTGGLTFLGGLYISGSASSGALAIGTTVITGGSSGKVLYNNGGVIGELAIGTDIQAYDADLAAIAGLTSVADKGIYYTGSATAATYDFTAYARTLMDDANAATARGTLGGTTVGQALFTLTNPSAITFIRINADNSVSALSDSAFRTAIGAGTGAGTVTSVGLSMPTELFTGIATPPVTSSGTLAVQLDTQAANKAFMGPTSGGAATPTFRVLVAADLPSTAVTPGSYANASLTVDAQGRLTAASSGASTSSASILAQSPTNYTYYGGL